MSAALFGQIADLLSESTWRILLIGSQVLPLVCSIVRSGFVPDTHFHRFRVLIFYHFLSACAFYALWFHEVENPFLALMSLMVILAGWLVGVLLLIA